MGKPNKMRPRKNGNRGRSTYVEEENSEKGVSTVMPVRKKGAGVRAWLLIDAYGGAQVVEAGKHTIMKRANLPARDLRMLDPLLSYPSTILGRERAIVVNIEHIKAIITANEVLLLNSKDPLVAPFVVELQRRLPVELGQQGNVVGATSFNAAGHNKESLSVSGRTSTAGFKQENIVSVKKGGPNMLPFEFRALEVCLEAACSCLDAEATALEQQAYPALDALTSKISTLNLERVRHIKSRLVAISGRVQKVRDEIEQLLDDDEDMAEMYLSDKMRRQQLEGTLSPSYSHNFGEATKLAGTTPLDSEDEEEGSTVGGLDVHCLSTSDKGDCGERVGSFRSNPKSSNCNSSTSTSNFPEKHLDVEELEMLLEAYFVHTDGTLNKLSALKEYVDDTEDYINIMLDDKQNHLLKMGVMLSTATLAISAFIVVTGVLGMNIKIPLFDNGTMSQFLCVVVVSGAASLLFYVLVIGWCKWKRLI
ncbi:hypothetical protein O6H91_08G105100 [Diphasiastrum complanatum]|uniref:Uncharacterized protein n=1 Tax=Diphasiastrum complanatum TaxID=34168 RepID=A0ACC2D104_DIPCM|nr:hypothetical protein O6H91_08G105100 [Diphasiastrum complanatum]